MRSSGFSLNDLKGHLELALAFKRFDFRNSIEIYFRDWVTCGVHMRDNERGINDAFASSWVRRRELIHTGAHALTVRP
jgi:hypothetical protein